FVTPPRPHAVRSDDSTSESKLAQPPTPAERARAFLTKMESVEAKAEDLEAFLMDEEKDSFDDAEDAGAASAAAVAGSLPCVGVQSPASGQRLTVSASARTSCRSVCSSAP
ncbi:MAG: hypothetical protein ACK4ZJ_16520, partial [Allorhizobium sp.]